VNVWLAFWTTLLIAVVAVFSILAVAIAIGGFFDLRKLLSEIDVAERDSSADNDSKANPH
jgi:hypothetical protein